MSFTRVVIDTYWCDAPRCTEPATEQRYHADPIAYTPKPMAPAGWIEMNENDIFKHYCEKHTLKVADK